MRKGFIYLGIIIGVIGLLLSIFYRPFVYKNNINDFHFADTLGSLFCVPSTVFFTYGLNNKMKFTKLLFLNVLVWIVYEIPSSLEYGIDTYDYVAIFIGAILTYLSFRFILFKNKANN